MYHYDTIEKAIVFIEANYMQQPDLKTIAEHVHMSEHHFQKTFTKWAGISPKKYVQWMTLNKAKRLINTNSSLLDTTYKSGLSSPARLHELFIQFEGMTPGEYKLLGQNMQIHYGFFDSPFGQMILAMSNDRICFLMFHDDKTKAIEELQTAWSLSELRYRPNDIQSTAASLFTNSGSLSVLSKGTPFQISVWRALLSIPSGHTQSYHDIAKRVEKPKANRAVGSAIGQNHIGYLIPCHRVIRHDGNLGNYRWGINRKLSMLNFEICHYINEHESHHFEIR